MTAIISWHPKVSTWNIDDMHWICCVLSSENHINVNRITVSFTQVILLVKKVVNNFQTTLSTEVPSWSYRHFNLLIRMNSYACCLFWKLQFLWLMNRLSSDNLALCCAFFFWHFCNFVWCYKLISRARSHKVVQKKPTMEFYLLFVCISAIGNLDWMNTWMNTSFYHDITIFIIIENANSY